MATAPTYRPRVLDGELDELMAGLPAIAIEGAKAVGKTSTASQRAATAHQLDDPDQRETAEADLDLLVSGPAPILLDEWQYLPPVWDKVRRAVDAGAPPGTFLLTGSKLPRDPGTHSGAGRIVSLRMRPMSLAERMPDTPTVSLSELLAGERPKISGRSDLRLRDYTHQIVRSGFPGLQEMSDRNLRIQLDSYLERVVDRDFPELGQQVRNPVALRRWMAAYAAATSTATSFEKIRAAASSGNGSPPARSTVQPYRDALERLFILDPLPAWAPTLNYIRRLSLPAKHHLADPALAARLLNADPDSLLRGKSPGPHVPRDGTLLGALFESLVTLSVRVYAQAAEATVGHLRTHRGEHEIDLIVSGRGGQVVAIEVKLRQVPDDAAIRNLNWLARQIGDNLADAIVVTTGEQAYRRSKDGIAVVPAALLGP